MMNERKIVEDYNNLEERIKEDFVKTIQNFFNNHPIINEISIDYSCIDINFNKENIDYLIFEK